MPIIYTDICEKNKKKQHPFLHWLSLQKEAAMWR